MKIGDPRSALKPLPPQHREQPEQPLLLKGVVSQRMWERKKFRQEFKKAA